MRGQRDRVAWCGVYNGFSGVLNDSAYFGGNEYVANDNVHNGLVNNDDDNADDDYDDASVPIEQLDCG